ncbi:OB-fold protein [Psychroserpens sp.]|uniref:OB-fold protein n=1 Tax=Psychroserpens sp. TaxID=2020870 RepID=UPI00385C2C5A
MSKEFKNSIGILVALTIIFILGYNYIYQDHRDTNSASAFFEVDTNAISSSFSKNMTNAESIYLNNTIEITGHVSESDKNSITLEGKVFCQFSNDINQELALNSNIKIKGRVIGYDDLLEQVKLDQCTIINN